MAAYRQMALQSFRRGLAYRGALYLRSFSVFLQVVIFAFFWKAIYASATNPPAGFSLEEMLAYVTVSQSVIFTVSLGADRDMADRIRDGSVALYLTRPADLQWSHLWESVGSGLFHLLFHTLPLLLLAWAVLGISFPLGPGRLLLFGAGLAMGFLVMVGLDMLAGVLSFLTLNNWGLSQAKNAVMIFFSGALVPLTAFPEWLEAVARSLPFHTVIYLPVTLYLHEWTVGEALRALALQAWWAALVLLLGRVALHLVVRRLTVQGG